MRKLMFVLVMLMITGCSVVDENSSVDNVELMSEADTVEEVVSNEPASEMEAILEEYNLNLVFDGEYCMGSEETEIGGVNYPVYPEYGNEGDILGQMLTAVACGEERLAETGFDEEYTGGLRVVLVDTEENTDSLNALNELGFVCEGNECEKSEAFMPIDLYPLLEGGVTGLIEYSDCTICG